MSKLFILLLSALYAVQVFGAPERRDPELNVKVEILYETQCPVCRYKMIEQYAPTYHTVGDIDINLYPYGNAKTYHRNGTIVVECQHGEKECYGNKVHACAIDILKHPDIYVTFIDCMMQGDGEGPIDDDAKLCAEFQKIDENPILECAKGKRGHDLLVKAGIISKIIEDNTYQAPLVRINGTRMDNSLDFRTEVCKVIAAQFPKDIPSSCVYNALEKTIYD